MTRVSFLISRQQYCETLSKDDRNGLKRIILWIVSFSNPLCAYLLVILTILSAGSEQEAREETFITEPAFFGMPH